MPAFASDGDGQATTRRLEALPLHRPSYDLSMYERVIVVARHAENVSWAAGVAANWAGNWATGDAGQIGAVEGRGHAGGEEGGEEVGDTTSDIGRAALGDGWGNTTRATGHAAKPAIFVVYEKANPHSRYNVPVNRGAEASAYLKYVLDHYDYTTTAYRAGASLSTATSHLGITTASSASGSRMHGGLRETPAGRMSRSIITGNGLASTRRADRSLVQASSSAK